MNILVTGAYGFLGKHISLRLEESGHNVIKYGRLDGDLDLKVKKSEFIFHLAGINRTDKESEFTEVNVGLTEKIIDKVLKTKRSIPIVFASSYQALQVNPYGISKKKAEDALLEFNKTKLNPIYIYRLPGIFGRWSKPYYNTVVATFIDQVLSSKPLTIHNPNSEIEISYIDDVVDRMTHHFDGNSSEIYQDVYPKYKITLQMLAESLISFKELEGRNHIPNLEDDFLKKLYSTYVSFKPEDKLSQPLIENTDHRGSFTEILKQQGFGQVSVNVSKPGIEKGHHYHHHKHEKFVVVSGHGEIHLRNLFSDKIMSFIVSEEKIELIDIPPGYVHSIKNTGTKDLVTIMWANETFDKEKPDTIPKKV
jgi:UDP-2-acetamido-2,6-beta-L-arabino-hexul-4-ose reductase